MAMLSPMASMLSPLLQQVTMACHGCSDVAGRRSHRLWSHRLTTLAGHQHGVDDVEHSLWGGGCWGVGTRQHWVG
jgi:hypothetical protein